MTPDALKDDCMLAALLKPQRKRLVYAKIGTMSLERVYVDHEPVLDATIRFKHEGPGYKWEDARVWKIDGELVYLERW